MIKSVAALLGAPDDETKPGRQLSGAFRAMFIVGPTAVYRNLLLISYLAANAYLFYRAFEAYGAAGANLYVQIARGAGACLNLNGALILVPMMRTLLTAVRRSFLGRLVPVDRSLDIHRLLGHAIFLFSLVHAAAHVLNYRALAVPLERSLLGTDVGLSGLIALGALLLMWFFALGFLRRSGWFEAFYFSHLLYVAFFGVLLYHAPDFWKWAAAPLSLFAVEIVLRRAHKRSSSVVTRSKVLPHGVTHLRLRRPRGFTFQPGDYLFLKLPKGSRFEWHPFTISSGAEQDEIGVHIRSLGNWTSAVHRRFAGLRGRAQQLPALINGPYGTPSGRIFRSRHAILIGAGIGITPFASILESLVHRREHGGEISLRKVYFFWLNRGRKSFQWFAELLTRIEDLQLQRFLQLNIYMTDVKLDASSGLMKIGMDLLGGEAQHDLTTGLRTVTNFGRPDWPTIFADISRRHAYRSVNVFFCGPGSLGATIRGAARRYGFRDRNEVF